MLQSSPNIKGLTSILDHLMITVVLVYEKQSGVDLVYTFLTSSFLSKEEN